MSKTELTTSSHITYHSYNSLCMLLTGLFWYYTSACDLVNVERPLKAIILVTVIVENDCCRCVQSQEAQDIENRYQKMLELLGLSVSFLKMIYYFVFAVCRFNFVGLTICCCVLWII